MLRTVLNRLVITASHSSAAPQIASRVLGPAVVAVSARYAGQFKNWFSSVHERKSPTFQDRTDDVSFDENEWCTPQPKKALDSDRFVRDHAFDPFEHYEKSASLMEEAAKKTALGKVVEAEPLVTEQPTAEELLEIELEHNEFIADHTFDVNDDKIHKNPKTYQ